LGFVLFHLELADLGPQDDGRVLTGTWADADASAAKRNMTSVAFIVFLLTEEASITRDYATRLNSFKC
jgi:hypothetical protein